MNKYLSILTVLLVFTVQVKAQEISIAVVNNYTACEGAVVDSGLSAG